jgi:cytoskeletal protein CcmA (bactofilin family)
MPKTIIGPHTRVAGPLAGTDDLVVEGIVEGTVTGEAQVTISAGAKVGGVVRGRDVIVGGALDFNVYGSASVRLLASAEVRADIEAPRIAIDDGALFEGQVRMVRAKAPVEKAPTEKAPVEKTPVERAPAPIAKGPPPPAPPVASVRAPAPPMRAIPELPQVGKRKLSRRTP